ncbi:trypsin-7-like isoform X1 [Sitodiplosis mosellana]|uniref:trypsin-7-like isoform X1 n=1 Tax=Sitodiplosis mosellana TaxID=263140 RepID=UPI002443AF49|nr:trypsin-7-like isoform X1 [Sitodiplosis mosellana]
MCRFSCLFMNALLCSSVMGSAKPFSNLSPRIVGGNVANITNHPYAAHIVVTYSGNNGVEFQSNCAAAIIGRDWILSAARCFDHAVIKKSVFHGGSTEKGGDNGKYSYLKPAIIHPKYNVNSSDYDFALAQLWIKLDWSGTIDYLDLPTDEDEIRNGDLCWTAGWGELWGYKSGRDEDDLLHEVMLPIYDHSICEKIYDRKLTQRMLCAGYVNGTSNKGICDDDWGAPLVCDRKLFGISSFIKENEPCGKSPAVFGRVKSIRKWIENETGIIPKNKFQF